MHKTSGGEAGNEGAHLSLYYATALILGLAFTLVLLTLAWNAATDEQERAFARETLAARERLGNRMRDLDRLLGQFAALLQQDISRPVLSRLCEQARRNEPALDAVAIVRPLGADDYRSPQPLCGPGDSWPSREAVQGALAAFPESLDALPLRDSRGLNGSHQVLLQRAPIPGNARAPLMLLRFKGSSLLEGAPLPPALEVVLEMESRGPLGRVTLLASARATQHPSPWKPRPLSSVQLSEFTNYALRLELRRPWTLAQFDFGMLASTLILGMGVTLLMLALARARELRIHELAQRNAVIEAQVAEQTQELAVARDEALVAAGAKADFLARMSHEIRTPLNAILGSLDALMNMQATPEQSHLMRMCERAGEGLLVLVNDVLDLSKIEAGQLQLERVEYSPREVMEEVAGMQTLPAAGKGLELVTDLAAGLPAVCIGDPTRLRQVLLNLLGNALKFTQQGEVILKAWVEEGTGAAALPELRFQVRDTGIGIPPEKLETVFERFAQADNSTTRRFGGTGLGLSISRQLMEGMGGRLWAENPAGGGGCLEGSLPLLIVRKASQPGADASDLPPAKVLVVEANASQREALRRACESLGAEVRAGAEGAAAKSLITPSWQPTVILWGGKQDTPDPLADLEALSRVCELPPRRILLLPALSGALPAHCAVAGVEVGIKPPGRDSLVTWLRARVHRPETHARRVLPEAECNVPRRSLLLVEDNDDNRQLVHAFLRGQSWDITDASDGVEAVQRCAERSFDLVLMDIQMPRMDGHAATRAIREGELAAGRPAARIIALTAHALPEELDRVLEAGCDGYLTKPLKKRVLLDFLAAELEARA